MTVFVRGWHVLASHRPLHSHAVMYHHLPMRLLTPNISVVCPRCRRRVVPSGFARSIVDESTRLMGSALVLDHSCLSAESAVRQNLPLRLVIVDSLTSLHIHGDHTYTASSLSGSDGDEPNSRTSKSSVHVRYTITDLATYV